jgi:hypothetical protein
LLGNLPALLPGLALAFGYWYLRAEFGWPPPVTYFLVDDDSSVDVVILARLFGGQIHAVLLRYLFHITVHCIELNIFAVRNSFHIDFRNGVVIAFTLHAIFTNFPVHGDGLGGVYGPTLLPGECHHLALLSVGVGVFHGGVGGVGDSLGHLLTHLLLLHLAALLHAHHAFRRGLETLRHLDLLAVTTSICAHILGLVVVHGANVSVVLAPIHGAVLRGLCALRPVHGVAPFHVLNADGHLGDLPSLSGNWN